MRAPHVEIVSLGALGASGLLAEYDASDDTIRIHAAAVARVRAALGEAEAARFVACAIAHERFHRAFPHASEAAAHAHARDACDVDPLAYERVARG